MTEGEKAIYIKFSLSLPQSFFKRKMTAPSSEGAFVGQPQGLFLRFVVVCTVSFATAFCCFSLTMQLFLFRKNHARLACSVVNALTTARCRYQLLRIFILLSAVNCIYQQQFNGGSKPPPYIVRLKLWDNMHLQHCITLHFRLVHSPLCFRHTHPTASRQRSIRILT